MTMATRANTESGSVAASGSSPLATLRCKTDLLANMMQANLRGLTIVREFGSF
jgi:hypothetical protein